MKRALVVLIPLAVIALSVMVFTLRDDVSAQDGETEAVSQQQGLMVKKLNSAQGLLTALAIGEYDGMVGHAEDLTQISLQAQWSAPYSTIYAKFGDQFRDGLAQVADSAKARNIDGAALGYVQMVFACVNCHDVVRDRQGVATLDLEERLQPGAILAALQDRRAE
jgi:hypothetical protein